MNLTTTQIIDAAIEQRRYPDLEELKCLKSLVTESQIGLQISKTILKIQKDILNKIRVNLSSKNDTRKSWLNLKNNSLEKRFSTSFAKYVATCIDYTDMSLRLTSYSLLVGESEHILKGFASKEIPQVVDTMGISLEIIFEDFNGIKDIVISQIPAEFKDKFLEFFQPISEVVLNNLIAEKIYKQALELFEDEEETKNWLSTPKTRLGGKTPLETMETKAGAEKVEEILYQAEFGMVS